MYICLHQRVARSRHVLSSHSASHAPLLLLICASIIGIFSLTFRNKFYAIKVSCSFADVARPFHKRWWWWPEKTLFLSQTTGNFRSGFSPLLFPLALLVPHFIILRLKGWQMQKNGAQRRIGIGQGLSQIFSSLPQLVCVCAYGKQIAFLCPAFILSALSAEMKISLPHTFPSSSLELLLSLCRSVCPLVMRYGWARLSWMLGAYSTYKKPLRSVINICQIAKLCYAFSSARPFTSPTNPLRHCLCAFACQSTDDCFFFAVCFAPSHENRMSKRRVRRLEWWGKRREREKANVKKESKFMAFHSLHHHRQHNNSNEENKKKGWNVSSTEGSQKKKWT